MGKRARLQVATREESWVQKLRDLTPGTRRFVEEYLIDCDPEAAARRAGFMKHGYGRGLLKNPRVAAAIEARMVARAGRVQVNQDFVLRRWLQLAMADARELMGIHFVPCRHCWGVEHSYQFTDLELRDAIARHRAEQLKLPVGDRVEFDERGGGGYTINREPCRGQDWVDRQVHQYAMMEREPPAGLVANSEESCPACFGDGTMRHWVADTRYLSASAATLYNGYKLTKDGMQILMRDRSHAEDMLAQHLGMVAQRREQPPPLDLFAMSEEQLNQVLQQVADSGLLVEGDVEDVEEDGG